MVLLDAALFDVVMQVPDAVLGIVLLVALLASPMGGREVARRRGTSSRRADRRCAARRTARPTRGCSGRGAAPRRAVRRRNTCVVLHTGVLPDALHLHLVEVLDAGLLVDHGGPIRPKQGRAAFASSDF